MASYNAVVIKDIRWCEDHRKPMWVREGRWLCETGFHDWLKAAQPLCGPPIKKVGG